MGKLVYSSIASLDGYIADADGNFAWAAPDEEVHAFVNELERAVGTYLYGRRMYETMRYWETAPTTDDEPAVIHEYAAIWRAADKIVFSRTLDSVTTARTWLEPSFDADLVRALKTSADRDVSIGGAELAGQALAAELVDEYHLFVTPVVVGGGTPSLPSRLRADLDLLDEHRFAGGVVHLHYAIRP